MQLNCCDFLLNGTKLDPSDKTSPTDRSTRTDLKLVLSIRFIAETE